MCKTMRINTSLRVSEKAGQDQALSLRAAHTNRRRISTGVGWVLGGRGRTAETISKNSGIQAKETVLKAREENEYVSFSSPPSDTHCSDGCNGLLRQ